MNISKNQLSLAGEFAVLSQLSLRGFNANLTLGNTKGVDILVSDPESGVMSRIEVKTAPEKITREKGYGKGKFMYWIMDQKHESIIDPKLFYCFVSIDSELQFRYFLVPARVVAKYVKEQFELWMSQRKTEVKDSPLRKFRIGFDDQSKYLMPTPSPVEYEEKWDLLQS